MSLRSGMLPAALVVAALVLPARVKAQMTAPNPYRAVEGRWGSLPGGRNWGASSGIWTSPDGRIVWVAERCGANTCTGSAVEPVLAFDLSGRLLRSFGGGLMAWPHGLYVDNGGNVWVTDAIGYVEQPPGLGHVVFKFSPTGELLMTLGRKGVAGAGPDHFTKPSAVVVAPDGSIFVADGHDVDGNNRIVKFDPTGRFVKEWGSTGGENGEFRDPHALAMDSQGRLFVADRGNSRIQVFDQEGKHLATWTQFGRPSGLYIDRNDVLYATDSESNTRRNPGWKRGIYIGSARTGWITGFIPDPVSNQDSSGTSGGEGVAVDAEGNVYSAEVGPRQVRRFEPRKP